MKIGIMGSGAVGSFFGSLLSEAGHDVKYIARGAHLAEMKKNGLTVIKDNEKVVIDQTFVENIEVLADCELILFCVKSGDTREIAESLKDVIQESAYVISFQNGVSNEEILVEVLGESRVLSAVVYVQASVESPGVIKQSGTVNLVIGALSDNEKVAAEKFGGVLKEAQIPTSISQQVMLRKWKKYLWNLIFNPLSAATEKTVGQILDDPHLREIAWMIGLEVVEIAKLSGYPLSEKDIHTSFQNAEFARLHTTSMLQDVQKGKVTEAEELIGYVLNKASEHQHVLNAVKTVYLLLKSKESNF